MFLPFLPLILASLGLSLLVLPMLPEEAIIPLEPIETLILLLTSSLLLGQWQSDRKSTRLNSSHSQQSRMPSSA